MATESPASGAPGRLRAGAQWALDIVFPRLCAACGQPVRDPALRVLCGTCEAKLVPITRRFCPRCGRPGRELIGDRCAECFAVEPAFDLARAFFLYAPPLNSLICLFKYGSKIQIGDYLADLLVSRLDLLPTPFRAADAIVPAPLHPLRWVERGFNQADILARALSRCLDIPMLGGRLYRVKYTERQAGLPARQRLANVRGAFKVLRTGGLVGRRVILVDDVITTGTTMTTCALSLKKAGVGAVYSLALAAAGSYDNNSLET